MKQQRKSSPKHDIKKRETKTLQREKFSMTKSMKDETKQH